MSLGNNLDSALCGVLISSLRDGAAVMEAQGWENHRLAHPHLMEQVGRDMAQNKGSEDGLCTGRLMSAER